MPAELATATAPPNVVRTAVSAVAELSVAVYVLQAWVETTPHRLPPWATAFVEQQPDLYGRICRFWSDGDHQCVELLVLAERADRLGEDAVAGFLAVLPGVAAADVPAPPLGSETAEARAIIAARLEALRASSALRARYTALLQETWAVLEPEWDARGRAAAAAAAASFQSRLDRGEPLRQLFPASCLAMRETFAALVSGAIEAGEFVVVPLYFAGDGQMLFELQHTVLFGLGLQYEEKGKRRREQAARAAGRFKLLADPTRLRLLATLLHTPMSVTELAERVELAQPTVSSHVKQLREAGLLDADRDGAQTTYRASNDRLDTLVREALADLRDQR